MSTHPESLTKAIEEIRRHREAQEASPPTDTVSQYKLVSVDVLDFLLGQGFLDGIDFSDAIYAHKDDGAFWWRTYLRKGIVPNGEAVTITKAEYDALVADAERWIYCREVFSEEICYALCGNSNPSNEELDQSIDSARKANHD